MWTVLRLTANQDLPMAACNIFWATYTPAGEKDLRRRRLPNKNPFLIPTPSGEFKWQTKNRVAKRPGVLKF